jgi:hypothetical protein
MREREQFRVISPRTFGFRPAGLKSGKIPGIFFGTFSGRSSFRRPAWRSCGSLETGGQAGRQVWMSLGRGRDHVTLAALRRERRAGEGWSEVILKAAADVARYPSVGG